MTMVRIAGGRVVDPANGVDEEVRDVWTRGIANQMKSLRQALESGTIPKPTGLAMSAMLYNAEGDPKKAMDVTH